MLILLAALSSSGTRISYKCTYGETYRYVYQPLNSGDSVEIVPGDSYIYYFALYIDSWDSMTLRISTPPRFSFDFPNRSVKFFSLNADSSSWSFTFTATASTVFHAALFARRYRGSSSLLFTTSSDFEYNTSTLGLDLYPDGLTFVNANPVGIFRWESRSPVGLYYYYGNSFRETSGYYGTINQPTEVTIRNVGFRDHPIRFKGYAPSKGFTSFTFLLNFTNIDLPGVLLAVTATTVSGWTGDGELLWSLWSPLHNSDRSFIAGSFTGWEPQDPLILAITEESVAGYVLSCIFVVLVIVAAFLFLLKWDLFKRKLNRPEDFDNGRDLHPEEVQPAKEPASEKSQGDQSDSEKDPSKKQGSGDGD